MYMSRSIGIEMCRTRNDLSDEKKNNKQFMKAGSLVSIL